MAEHKGFSRSPNPFINDFSQILAMKGKRRRTMISSTELEKLENYFLQDMWPSRKKKELLAQQMGKTEKFVDIWFQNRRARMRKLSKEKDTRLREVSIPKPVMKLSNNNTLRLGLVGVDKPSNDNGRPSASTVSSILDHINPPLEETKTEIYGSENESIPAGQPLNDLEQVTMADEIRKAGPVRETKSKIVNTGVKVQTGFHPNVQAMEGLLWGTQRRLLLMAAATEGVLQPSDPNFSRAFTDAETGIQLTDSRVFYDELGFDFEPLTLQ